MKKHHRLATRKRLQTALTYSLPGVTPESAIDLLEKLEAFEKEFTAVPAESNRLMPSSLLTTSLITEEFI
jgi:ERCC4-type nuclease